MVFAYTSIPTFKEADKVLFEEKRLGVDVLDAIVVVGCLGTMAIFPGAVLCWCLSFGRVLVKRTQDNSKKLLLNAFGKQPRYVWLYRDGAEVQVSLDRLQKGDIIVVNTGEVVPVDGHVVEGMAMIDQHALTGESTPAEKGVGDRVFASTVMVAGKVFVSVETSGSETASAKISQILNDTAGYKLSVAAQGRAAGRQGGDPDPGHRRGRPGHDGPRRRGRGAQQRLRHRHPHGRAAGHAQLAGPVRQQGHPGQGRPGAGADERGRHGPLRQDRHADPRAARGRPDHRRRRVRRPSRSSGSRRPPSGSSTTRSPWRSCTRPRSSASSLPPTDDTQYKVGYGITVSVEGHTDPRRQQAVHGDGRDRAAARGREALGRGAPRGLHDGDGRRRRPAGRGDRAAGVGPARGPRDHRRGSASAGSSTSRSSRATTRPRPGSSPSRWGWTATSPRSCPPTRPTTSTKLQKEGRKVCFVGDGINDSIALKKANVSISLRGASSIATDTAHIVFLEEGLAKLCELRDIARDLDRNVKRSWSMILAPNIACIVGVFTMGFGIMASVVTNNVAALAALANGVLPLRKVAQIEAERRHQQEMSQSYAMERNSCMSEL